MKRKILKCIFAFIVFNGFATLFSLNLDKNWWIGPAVTTSIIILLAVGVWVSKEIIP